MWLASLLLTGGFVYWVGLIRHEPTLLGAGASALLLALGVMVLTGNIETPAVPLFFALALLCVALQRCPTVSLGVTLGWMLFIVLVLVFGFQVIPFFTPVDTLHTIDQAFYFRPEKALLMLLVPPMVLVSWSVTKDDGLWIRTRFPSLVALWVLLGTLALIVPLGLLTGYLQPGLASQSATTLVYWLTYNLIYSCVLEESFFRGLLQTFVVRRFRRLFSTTAAPLAGILVAALLFGLAHFGGGLTYVLLVTLAGIGYGLVYEMTGRLHYAVWVHFAVNTLHHLVFAGISV